MTNNRIPTIESPTATQWLARLDNPDQALHAIYGNDPDILYARVDLLRAVVKTFLLRFGDCPLRLFRSPGRINLRGMHVDTHGGYLNLMTHQREVVLAVSPSGGPTSICVNINPMRDEVAFDAHAADVPNPRRDWLGFINDPALQAAPHPPRGHWGRYMEGCALRVRHAFPEAQLRGLSMAVGGDIPEGAALSSSAALCVAGVSAVLACNGLALDPAALILAARDAEWYAGSRCGVSDQAAMVLGGPGQVVNVALLATQLDVSGMQRISLPDDVRILVANSHTKRSLSGAEMLDYTRNRFAYSLALEVLRSELPPSVAQSLDRLSKFSPETLPEWRDPRNIYRLIEGIPEEIDIDSLRDNYDLQNLGAVYEQYFGSLPPEQRPTHFHLRGPLLFGLAESERARIFAHLLEGGDFERAGRLMSIGHDGDRRLTPGGAPYRFPVDDTALRAYAAESRPLADCPGVYGASSPVLDTLVDTALDAGALGACLTGAGIAGTVLALCRTADAPAVANRLRQRLSAPGYPHLAHLKSPLTPAQLDSSIVINQATAAAGELPSTATSYLP
ncbi:MAG: galactokinase family protein [FCB group bacterium]|jgi:galactokinase|nr:galactokinase family protein [FCB group bacterium]